MNKPILIVSISVAALAIGTAIAARNEHAPTVPTRPAFSEFRGFEGWSVIAVSENGGKIAAILGNPVIIAAYKSGIPGNGKPFPNGSRMAKVHWIPKHQQTQPGDPVVPGTLHDVDFMVKDSERFADSGGWGWAAYEYEAASGKFRPANLSDAPPQGNDAKCGFACHTIVKTHDFVFTEYAKR
jgi:Cytochrome P460